VGRPFGDSFTVASTWSPVNSDVRSQEDYQSTYMMVTWILTMLDGVPWYSSSPYALHPLKPLRLALTAPGSSQPPPPPRLDSLDVHLCHFLELPWSADTGYSEDLLLTPPTAVSSGSSPSKLAEFCSSQPRQGIDGRLLLTFP
jgi:hypothetical protein